MIKITDEMKQRVDKAFEEKKYCVWATTSDDGFPDMSFRGSTFVFDDEHIAFWDRSLGQSTTNLEKNPHVCMLFYDKENRLGWRFYGTATVLKDGDVRQQIMRRTTKAELDKDPERKGYGVLVRIDKIRGYSGFNVVQERYGAKISLTNAVILRSIATKNLFCSCRRTGGTSLTKVDLAFGRRRKAKDKWFRRVWYFIDNRLRQ